jgi:hypothetical protein
VDCLPLDPYSSCSYVVQTVLMLGVTFAASYYLFVNYADDRSPHVLVISALAAMLVAGGGIWANANAATVAGAFWYGWLLAGLLGVGIGLAYVTMTYGARPASARSGAQIVSSILLFGGIGVVVYLGRLQGNLQPLPPDAAAVAAIGALVGISELVSRYRDEPTRALFTMPALLYVALNAVAGLLALGLGASLVNDTGEVGMLGVRWGLVLACGLGAMAILRSALFVVRTDGKDLQVGLGSLVQTLLDSADRALDRLRAEERAWTVAKLMEQLMSRIDGPTGRRFGVLAGAPPRRRIADEVFRLVVAEVVALLPGYCVALTQNLEEADRQAFLDAATALRGTKDMTDEVKLFTLGLLAMNSVGPRVLGAAVASLGPDLLHRAERTAEAEAMAQQVEASTNQTAKQAQVAADTAQTAANTARSEGASPTVQAATTEAADAAGQAAQSASATQQAATGLTASVIAAAEPPPPAVVTATTLTPAETPAVAESAPAPATNGVHTEPADAAAQAASTTQEAAGHVVEAITAVSRTPIALGLAAGPVTPGEPSKVAPPAATSGTLASGILANGGHADASLALRSADPSSELDRGPDSGKAEPTT